MGRISTLKRAFAHIKRVVARVSNLLTSRQKDLAVSLLAEYRDEALWAESFANSSSTLEQLADVALAEHRCGVTQSIDPERW
jgi:hypothetical protein